MENLSEDILGNFNSPGLEVIDRGPVRGNILGSRCVRDEKGNLAIFITTRGRTPSNEPDIPPGTVYLSKNEIHFKHISGAIFVAGGVVYRGYKSNRRANGHDETEIEYSVHSLSATFDRRKSKRYTVEWVDNLSDLFFWPTMCREETTEDVSITIGEGSYSFPIDYRFRKMSSRRALHFEIDGFQVYLFHREKSDKQRDRAGYILYQPAASEEIRHKIRDCLSFVFGLPIVFLGYNDYSAEHHSIYKKSFSAYSFGGRAFDLNEQVPFPVSRAYNDNLLDVTLFSLAVKSLYSRYDALELESLLWAYWHAVMTPASFNAVYFGSLIERMQKLSKNVIGSTQSCLVEKFEWRLIKFFLISVINSRSLGHVEACILRNKISGMNQLPQSIAMKRFFENNSLTITQVEMDAWKQRNTSAHGGSSSDHIKEILNSKILRILFHRIVGKITGCSASYYDYYSLGFPIRNLEEGIVARSESEA